MMYRRYAGEQLETCNMCGTRDLYWRTVHSRPRLHDSGGRQHYCLTSTKQLRIPEPKKLHVIYPTKIPETKLCKEMDKMQMRDRVTLLSTQTVLKAGDRILYRPWTPYDRDPTDEKRMGRFILFNQESDEVVVKDSKDRGTRIIPLRFIYARSTTWYTRMYTNSDGQPAMVKTLVVAEVEERYAPNGTPWLVPYQMFTIGRK